MNMKVCNRVSTSVFTFLPLFLLLIFISQGANASSKHKKTRQRTISCDSYSRSKLLSKADKYQPLITKAAQEYKVSPHLITAVITVESCFRPKARSSSGAAGLMQLMPATARRFGATNRYSSKHNIKAGTKYLKFLLTKFNGNVQLAAAAYNAGEGAVEKYNGVPPYKQTQAYVRKVLNAYRKLSSASTGQMTAKTTTHRTREWYRARFEHNRLTHGLNLSTREIQHINELLGIEKDNSAVTLSFKQFL